MSQIKITRGGGSQDEVIISTDVTVETQSSNIPDFDPVAATNIEYDQKEASSSITTTCGESESRRTGSNTPDIVIEGFLLHDEIPALKSLRKGDEVFVYSDIHSGQIYVKRVTITQTNGEVTIQPRGNNGSEQLGYQFQLQLGQNDSA